MSNGQPTSKELAAQITHFLAVGGYWNPEVMERDKIRDLLIACREYLTHEPPAVLTTAALNNLWLDYCEAGRGNKETGPQAFKRIVAEAVRKYSAQPPVALQKLIDAAIEWAHCPDAGSYRDGSAVEDTCEQLHEAVCAYLGKHIDSPPFPDHWTVEQMRERLGLTKCDAPKCLVVDCAQPATRDGSWCEKHYNANHIWP
jgi:hypothetical protein